MLASLLPSLILLFWSVPAALYSPMEKITSGAVALCYVAIYAERCAITFYTILMADDKNKYIQYIHIEYILVDG